MFKFGKHEPSFVEVYQFRDKVVSIGLRLGFVFDMTQGDLETGENVDLNPRRVRSRAQMWISQFKSALVIGSERCSATERLKEPEPPKRRAQTIANSFAHTKFMLKIYQQQMGEGRYFLHTCANQAWNSTRDVRV